MWLVRLFERLLLGLVQVDVQCLDRLIQMGHFTGPNDGCAHSRLGQDPRQSYLRILYPALGRNFGQPVHHRKVRWTIVELLREVIGLCADSLPATFAIAISSQKTARQRTPGN